MPRAKSRTKSNRAGVARASRRPANKEVKEVIVECPPELLRYTKEEKLEREIAESLRANASLDRRIMHEFKHVDAESEL